MSNPKAIITAGIAMFAMFFGSGNLVFPLNLGVKSGDQYLTASIGFILTGVLVPFMGLFSVMLYDGDRSKYFGLLGKNTAFILAMILLALLGPFGVVPRCTLVAYGGFKALFPGISLSIFSVIFSFLILLIVWEENNFIPIIGRILGPIKIATIGTIIVAALIFSPTYLTGYDGASPMLEGIIDGYQTMDLPAAFFFSVTIMSYLKEVSSNKEKILQLGILSSFVGGGLIAIIYLLFTHLGAYYAPALTYANPEEYLATITDLSLGKMAAITFATTMFFACITTACTLGKLFAEFLQHDIAGDRISWHQSIILTVIISCILSLTGFSTISGLLCSILKLLYPALIAFTIASIVNYYKPIPYMKHIFWSVFLYEAFQHFIF